MDLLVLTMDVQDTVKKKFNYFSEGEFFYLSLKFSTLQAY